MTCPLHPQGAFGCDHCGNSRDWKEPMSDEAKPKPLTMADMERADWSPQSAVYVTVQALDAAKARIAELEAGLHEALSMQRAAVKVLNFAERERDEWKKRAEDTARALAEKCESCAIGGEWQSRAERAEAERDELARREVKRASCCEANEADAARMREALGRIARGHHWLEEFPDQPVHWPQKLTCARCRAIGEDIDHLDKRHKQDCPTLIARAALAGTDSGWLRERLMRVAKRAYAMSDATLGADLDAIVDAELKR